MTREQMEEPVMEDRALAGAEGRRLFVDLGSGAGAIPVRAEESSPPFFRSSFFGVLIFMALLAAGGIWGMRKLGLGPRTASAAAAELTIEHVQQPAVEAGRFEKLMAELERGDRPVQIPPSKLSEQSPFEFAGAPAQQASSSQKETDAERQARLAEEARLRAEKEREARIAGALAQMKLYAVVGGRVPAARINAQIVREGDVVADLFTVSKIHDRSVTLQCDGKEYELQLSSPSSERGH